MRLLKKFFNLKLAYKLIIANILVIILPVVILGLNSYSNLYRHIQTQSIREAREQLQQRIGLIRENITLIESFSANIGYGSYLSSFLTDHFDNTPDEYDDYRQISSNLNSLIGSNSKLVNSVSIYYFNNEIPEKWPLFYKASRLDPFYLKEYNIDLKDTGLSENESIQLENVHFKPVYFENNEVVFIQPLVSGISTAVIGFLKVGVHKDHLFSAIMSGNAESHKYLITDSKGKVVFDPAGIKEQILPMASKMDNDQISDDGLLIIKSAIEQLKLNIYSVSSQEQMYQNALDAQRNILVVVILGVIASSLAGWILVNILMLKLNRVLRVMKDVSAGDFNRRADVNSNDEAGVLASTFNYMLDNIQQLKDMLVKRERLLKEAEINALQNQINPHFIYNILEVFKVRLEMKNEVEISNALYSVGKMLRYSTNWSQESRLGQEIMHVEHYVKLQKLNQDKDIQFFFQCEKQLLNCKTPKMILQPLVENCIIHGIANRDALHITIRAFTENQKLYVEVFDDGTGIKPEEMEKVLLEMESNSGRPKEGKKFRLSGIGLKNIHDRLRLMYGEEYGLKIQSEQDLYTKVTAVIPYIINGVEE